MVTVISARGGRDRDMLAGASTGSDFKQGGFIVSESV